MVAGEIGGFKNSEEFFKRNEAAKRLGDLVRVCDTLKLSSMDKESNIVNGEGYEHLPEGYIIAKGLALEGAG